MRSMFSTVGPPGIHRARLDRPVPDYAKRRPSQVSKHKVHDMTRASDFESLTAPFAKTPCDAQIAPGRAFGSLRAVIDGLPPLCRGILMLRKVHRLSHAEIADVFGLSSREIEKYVAEGLVRCQERLRQPAATREQKSP